MVGTYSYVNPAIAAILGWWFLDEHLGANQLTGMAIMFAGVALVNWPQKDVKRLDDDQQKDPSTAGLRLTLVARADDLDAAARTDEPGGDPAHQADDDRATHRGPESVRS